MGDFRNLAAVLPASLRALALLCRFAAFLLCHCFVKKRIRATGIESIAHPFFFSPIN